MKTKLLYKTMLLMLLIVFLLINNVSAANTTLSNDEIVNASSSVKNYIESNHKLPKNITISKITVNMPQFLKLETTAIYNINNNINSKISLGSYNNATSPTETTINGNISKINYLALANNVIAYMNTNKKAPNYQSTSLGNLRYENLIYTFAEILDSYKIAKSLPNFIVIRPWSLTSNKKTVFINMVQIKNSADTVQFYTEYNHKLPKNITITGSTVYMPQFLKLVTTYLIYGKDNLYQSIPLGNYNAPPAPDESITGGTLELEEYYTKAIYITDFMDSNGRAPNAITTTRGNIRYENLVYTYAQIVNSASKNKRLPNYINLKPWTTITDKDTVFLTMEQIISAVWMVKNNVETNHSLPSNITISERQINMPSFLKLEVMTLKNIYAGLYQSLILESFSSPTNPTETIVTGKINYENYMNVVDNVINYMNTNGRAPNYQSTVLGNMRFESLVFMYSQLLNYYNVNSALPQHITVNQWNVVSNTSTISFNIGQIISSAESLVNYAETTHSLPSTINITGTSVSRAEFLKLLTSTIQIINGNLCGQLINEDYNEPGSMSETTSGGVFKKTEYLELAKEVENFIIANGRGPNFQTTDLGNIHYKSLVYLFSQILRSYHQNNYKLPSHITIRPWSVIYNSNTKFFTINEIGNASGTVETYLKNNHTLPSTVNINGTSITMPEFLKILSTAITNVYGKLKTNIVLESYDAASSPSETITGGCLSRSEYLELGEDILSFMDTNKKAPSYQTTSFGNIRFHSLVFMFSQIMNYYITEKKLPRYISVDKWSLINNDDRPFFTLDQIKTAATTVQTFIETNHKTPSNVNINGTAVSMPQFLQLAASATQNAAENLYTTFILGAYNSPPSPSEDIYDDDFSKDDYLNLADEIIEFMYVNGRAPNYKECSNGKIQYQSLIYLFSQILSSNKKTGAIAQSFTLIPWTNISNINSIFITQDQITNASKYIKSYIDTYNQLPTDINISGHQVTMPQFLKISAQSVLNIANYLNTTVILESVGNPLNSVEKLSVGTIYSGEFADMAKDVLFYINNQGLAPNKLSNTSLGDAIGYESLIYMFSKIIISYNAFEHAPDQVDVIPWLALTGSKVNLIQVENIVTGSDTLEDTTGVDGTGSSITSTTDWAWDGLRSFKVVTNGVNPDESLNICKIGSNSISYGVLVQYGQSYNVSAYIKGTGTVYIKLVGRNSSGTSTESYNSPAIKLSNIPQKISFSHSFINSNTVYATANILTNSAQKIIFYVDEVILNSTAVVSNLITEDNISTGSDILGNTTGVGSSSATVTSTADWAWQGNKSFKVQTNGSIINEGITICKVGAESIPYAIPVQLNKNYTISTFVKGSGTVIISLVGRDSIGAPTESYNGVITTLSNTPQKIFITHSFSELETVYATAKIQTNSKQSIIFYVDSIKLNEGTLKNEGTFNLRTQKDFYSIQSAIDDPDTVNGDTIWLGNSQYIENVIINKKVTIQPFPGIDVIVKAKYPDSPVFTINNEGNESTIREINIKGSANNAGVYIYNSSKNNILKNHITENNNGIYSINSTDCLISGNEILSNFNNGILILNGSNNKISENEIDNNVNAGIEIQSSDYNCIFSNNIYSNKEGIHLFNASTKIHYNRISENSKYGLNNEGNGTLDAINNWWGSNNPIVSLNNPCDIRIAGGTVTYDPYTLLTINCSTNRSDRSDNYYNYTITADLTHNNQGNESSDGNIPDSIPVNFNTTLGNINPTAMTKKGRAELKLSGSVAGKANVSANLDKQIVSLPVGITSINVLGVYNTRTKEYFTSIQNAIDDSDTVNGDTITLAEGIYLENMAVNKRIIIQPVAGANVIIKTDESNKDVILLNNGGSGSTIQGINIRGSSDSSGIALSHVCNVIIKDNIISECNKGIYLFKSGNISINNNTIKNNYYGLEAYKSCNNEIKDNFLIENQNGVYLNISNLNSVNSNVFKDNWFAIYLILATSNNLSENEINNNWVGIYLFDSNDVVIETNALIENGVGITNFDCLNILISENTFSDNCISDTSVVDSSNMVIATTNFSCGPAALATVLKNLGVMTTELEIADLAGTDINGTTLLGLKKAAIALGASAIGVKISSDQLQTDNIVILSINGYYHFVILENINDDSVTLIDPNLGTINMSRNEFDKLFSGFVLIINGSAPSNSIKLTDEEMQNIKANGHWEQYYAFSYWKLVIYVDHWTYVDFGGFWYPYCYFNFSSWQWVYGWSYYDLGGMWLPVYGYYWQQIPVYYSIYVPDVTYQYKESRVIPCTLAGISIAGVILGCFCGATEGLTVFASIGLLLGGVGTILSEYQGEITKAYIDPWLKVSIDGHEIYPCYWW